MKGGIGIPETKGSCAGSNANSKNEKFESWWNKYFENSPERTKDDHTAANSIDNHPNEVIYNVLTEKTVSDAMKNNQKVIIASKRCVITPLADELIKRSDITIKYE